MAKEEFDDTELKLADIATTDEDVPKMDTDDVDQDIDQEAIERSPREDIYAAYDEKQNKEIEDKGDEPVELEQEESEEGESLETAKLEEEAKEEDGEPETVTVKIYGEEREVQKKDIDKAGGIDAYQIITANRERLDETNRLREEVKAEKERLEKEREEWEAGRNEESESGKRAKEEEESNRLNDLYEQLESARIDADAEEAARLQRQIDDERAAKANQQQPNLEQMVEERLAAYDREADRRRGIAWFNEQHKELAEDPELKTIVHNKVVAMEQEYPQAPKSELIRVAADTVAKWWEDRSAPAQQTSERVEKKRRLRQPKAASARQQPKAEPKPQTRSDAVAQMRRDRGLED